MPKTSQNLSGKTALVTGASSGIGKVTASALATMGATVYLVCRNRAKGGQVQQEIKDLAGHERVFLIVADLAEQAQVRRAAQEFLDTGEPLHILHNNAGITNTARIETVDGIEETFAVNHLAYFLLTNLLLDRLKESAPARIVNVASDAHYFVRGMQFDDLEYVNQYKTFKVYGQSKLANLLFALALAPKLAGTDVTINSVHPGVVTTGLGMQNDGLLSKIVPVIGGLLFRSPEKGAESSIYVCTSPALNGVSGKYYANCRQKTPKRWARDVEAAEKLWEISEQMTAESHQ